MKIIGLRIEKYIGQNIDGHNCDFTYHDEEMERHIICGILSDGRKVEITLSEEYGECYSGWTTASWGKIEVNQVEKFNGYTHIPKEVLIIDDIEPGQEIDTSNRVFQVSEDGGDNYYPSGYYSVNMDLFTQSQRHRSKRPVWFFKGNSNLGKSFLSSRIEGLSVYETDIKEDLPETITEDIIVIGNKYNHGIDDIKSRLFGETEIILVEFKESE